METGKETPNQGKHVALPDELWRSLLEALPGAAKGIETSVRLLSGEVIERLIISNRGYVLGKEATGLAGYHGTFDNSMLIFNSDAIEAVQIPAFYFWQKPKRIALNPPHPNRLSKRTK